MPIIALSKSLLLMRLLIAVHALSFLVLCMLPFPLWARAIFALLLGPSLWFYLRRDAFKLMRQSTVAIKWLSETTLEVHYQSGASVTATLQPGSFVAPYLTTLVYRPEAARFNRFLIVLPDMLDANSFRELRVHLRWQSP